MSGEGQATPLQSSSYRAVPVPAREAQLALATEQRLDQRAMLRQHAGSEKGPATTDPARRVRGRPRVPLTEPAAPLLESTSLSF